MMLKGIATTVFALGMSVSSAYADWISIEGKRCQIFIDGGVSTASWTGGCVGNKANGNGTATYYYNGKFHAKYEGGMKGGKPVRGSYTFASGDRYTGSYKDGKPHGLGSFTRANGEEYEGDFKNGMFDGIGILFLGDGRRYSGEFKNDKPHGYGDLTNYDGRIIYSGIWVNGNPAQ